ncbi:MAG: glycosyltransferase family 2 protein [Rhodospirillales bacterium]|nr:glycosyltransferase family 2 protein [Rhodospirillales bacterium]
MNTPLISIITPVYNMEAFIGPAIQSVLDQTCIDFELLLIDDCSTDGSMDIMESFASKDARVKILSTPVNSWAHIAGNVGLDHAKGKYIAILDADDLLPNDRFKRQIDVLEGDPELDICGGWMKLFGDSNKTLNSFQSDNLKVRMGLLFDSTMGHGTAMIRRSVIEAHHIRYDTDIFYAHDYHFFTQLAFDGHARFTSIPAGNTPQN